MSNTWSEYGVLLKGGFIARAASEAVAVAYPHGWPVVRVITSTPVRKSGEAVMEVGCWMPLRAAA